MVERAKEFGVDLFRKSTVTPIARSREEKRFMQRRVEACVTLLAPDETCVVVISRDLSIDFKGALGEFPALRNSLRNGELEASNGVP